MELLVVLVIAGGAVAAVLVPLLRRGPAHDPELDGAVAAAPVRRDREEIEAQVRRYRAALQAGTVCRRCGRANAAGSRFCAECGRRLAAGRGRSTPAAA